MAKILVIEDSAALLQDILEMLALENYDAVGAKNGRIGVELAKTYRPDLIICDIRMPEMDGYDVLKAIRDQVGTLTTPFIFLTARSSRSEMRHGMDLGADDYLTKPFTVKELITTIKVRLARKEVVTGEYERQLDGLRRSIVLSIPHELRTPLNSILGFSEILQTDATMLTPDKVVEMSKYINSAAKRLGHLVENYVVYTHLEMIATDDEQRALLREAETTYPAAIIQQETHARAHQYRRAEDLQLTLANDVDHLKGVRPDNLLRIVGELTDNAFKFSKSGTAVKVKTGCQPDGFVMEFEDNGRGMTPEEIASIGAYMQFNRDEFEQQGIGLGLAIAKRLVELHDGQFEITSDPGEKTKVRVLLPTG